MVAVILLTLNLVWPVGDTCRPEKFTVEIVQPSTRIYTSQLACGGIKCEETWITYEDKRIGAKSTCPVSTPPQSPSPQP